MKPHHKRNLRFIVLISCFSSIAGCLLGYLLNNKFLPGLTLGFVISLFSSSSEIYLFKIRWFQQRRMWQYLIITTLVHFTISLVPIAIAIRLVYVDSFIEIASWPKLPYILVFVGMMLFVFTFFRRLFNIIGGRMMLNLFFARYFKPREVNRIFMFLDLNDSTQIAERLGHVKFHSLLRDFFFDVGEVIMLHRGDVYKYVGDEVIVIWPIERGAKDAACVRCCFDILAEITKHSETYLKLYGVRPLFKAGIHVGPATIGEMGLLKHEIAYLGDTLNTTARIMAQAGQLGKQLLISKELLSHINLPPQYMAASTGMLALRGKVAEMELFSIEEI